MKVSDAQIIREYHEEANAEYKEYLANSWWNPKWQPKRKEIMEILVAFGICFGGIAGAAGYIAIWVLLWEFTGYPAWIFIILGIGCVLTGTALLRRNRKCGECGVRNMRVLDTIYDPDAGYQLYDVLRCKSCGHTQRG